MILVSCHKSLSQQQEQQMRDWVEMYRPVRQKTVQSETTKDKAGTLPIAVYSNKDGVRTRANEDYVLQIADEDSEVNHEENADSDIAESNTDDRDSDSEEHSADTADVTSSDKTDEYDTDSDSDQDDNIIMSRTTRFGRRITHVVRMDL